MHGHDLFPADAEVKAQLLLEYEQGAGEQLLKELAQRDAKSFGDYRSNWRRALRALEICRITGKPLAESRGVMEEPLGNNFAQVVLLFSPERLRERIRLRCQQMIDAGWIEEAAALFDKGLMESPTAQQAIGYPLIHEYLFPVSRPANQKHLSIPNVSVLVERIATKTVQYAKQQRAWFKKRHNEATFIEMDALSKEQVMDLILGQIGF
jgi:tRNA dimethylallyltransferase